MNIQIFGTKKCNDTKKAERLLLIYITYKIYSIWKLLVLLAPLIVYGITYIIKEKRGD